MTKKEKKSRKISSFSQQCAEQSLFLPRLHPPDATKKKKKDAKEVVVVKESAFRLKKPFTRVKHFDALQQQALDPDKKYEGEFLGGYMSEQERRRREEVERKKKFLGGEFRGFSGVASAIPLRREGTVRCEGAYLHPDEVTFNREKPKLLEGPWRPTPRGKVELSPLQPLNRTKLKTKKGNTIKHHTRKLTSVTSTSSQSSGDEDW